MGKHSADQFIYAWLEMNKDVFCVDTAGKGDNKSGTPAAWATCPQ